MVHLQMVLVYNGSKNRCGIHAWPRFGITWWLGCGRIAQCLSHWEPWPESAM